MTGRIENTVFISYRRTNFWTALAVFQNLTQHGFDVFLDYRSIPSGDFEQVITENVKARAHFIVILGPYTLERCNEPGDWLRREIEFAIETKRNIIPLMIEGFDFTSLSTEKSLTGKLANLQKYNAIGIPAEYFDEAMAKLRGASFLGRPLESILHPVSDLTNQITDEQHAEVTKVAPVEREQLTAEKWFERGMASMDHNLYEEAIDCFTNTIDLQLGTYLTAAAYANRGFARRKKGDLDGALRDASEADDLWERIASRHRD